MLGVRDSLSLSQFAEVNDLDGITSSPQLSPHPLSVHGVMLEAYKGIGDPDAVYGCGAGKNADIISRSVLLVIGCIFCSN